MRVSGSVRCHAGSCRKSPSPRESGRDTAAPPASAPSVDPSQRRSLSDPTCSRKQPPSPTRRPTIGRRQSPADCSAEAIERPRLSRPAPRSTSRLTEQSSYSIYPNPRSRFLISSFDVLLSSGKIFLVSFSSMWITNSSIDSYPAASEHCLTFSSSSPSIFTLCEPNMASPHFSTLGLSRLPRLEHRLPQHLFRLRNPEFSENRRRDIGQRRSLRVDLAIAQQHSRHLREVHTMIAAPRIRIILKHVRRKRPQNRLPSRPIATVIAHQRIRPRACIRPLISLAGKIDARNHLRSIFRIAHLQQLFADLVQKRIGLSASLYNPLALASTKVQVKSVQPESIRARAAPIHIGKRLGRISTAALLPRNVAVIRQPRVQVEGMPVGS